MIVDTDIDDWEDFEWDPSTCIGVFSRDVPWQLDPLVIAERLQPAHPAHDGWAELSHRPRRCLSLV